MLDQIQELTAEMRILRTVFEFARQAVFVVDARSQRIVDANPAALAQLGRQRPELIGCSWKSVAASLPDAQRQTASGFEIWMAGAGSQSAAHHPLQDRFPRDVLTGLANRAALLARLSPLDTNSPTAGMALLFIDLDGFKNVNDTWGHVVGDRVLRVVAARLAESIRPDDLVVRFGGDEFIVLVEGLTQRRGLERLAQRIRRSVRLPIAVEGREIVITASIGIARQSSLTPTSQSLIAAADREMYRIKALSRSTGETLSMVVAGHTTVTTQR